MTHKVDLTEYAIAFIEEHVYSERVYKRILSCIRMIGDYPQCGRAYDPEYAAMRPPFPCRILPVADTPFVLYYTNDLERELSIVFCIEFAAGDPMKRFSELFGEGA